MRTCLAAFALLVSTVAAIAGPVNVSGGGLALKGYDPVAYFTVGKPVKGVSSLNARHDGATYHFSSAANLATFKSNPAKYAPQYGGYCAYGFARGYAAKVEIDQFTVANGKLYLNYNASVKRRWETDIPGYVAKANRNYANAQ